MLSQTILSLSRLSCSTSDESSVEGTRKCGGEETWELDHRGGVSGLSTDTNEKVAESALSFGVLAVGSGTDKRLFPGAGLNPQVPASRLAG